MNEDEKSFIIDMVKSEGWRLFEQLNKKSIENYRFLATQPPKAVPEELRLWYSALAAGREEALQEIKEKIQKYDE